MRTIAWEEVFQIALKNCSKEAAGNVSIYIYDFGEGGGTCNHAHIFTEGLMKVAASHKEQMSSCHHEGF